jgi:hypothetical protein
VWLGRFSATRDLPIAALASANATEQSAAAAIVAESSNGDRRAPSHDVESLSRNVSVEHRRATVLKAKSPTFERLLERAKQATPETQVQAPVDEAQASSVVSAGSPSES